MFVEDLLDGFMMEVLEPDLVSGVVEVLVVDQGVDVGAVARGQCVLHDPFMVRHEVDVVSMMWQPCSQ